MANNGNAKLNLTANQRRAIAALMAVGTIRGAAKKAKVAERTLHRWLKENAAFQDALAQAEAESHEVAARRAADLVGTMFDVLRSLATNESVPESVRARVALGLLDYHGKIREQREFAARLARIEEALGL